MIAVTIKELDEATVREFSTPYSAALYLLEQCSLVELQSLALRELRTIKMLAAQRPHADIELEKATTAFTAS